MKTYSSIQIVSSNVPDAGQAVAHIAAAFANTELALLLFFCSSDYDLPALSQALNQSFPQVLIVGCTTAGEIGPQGYVSRTLVAAGFPNATFRAAAGAFLQLPMLDAEACRARVSAIQDRMPAGWSKDVPLQRFALHLIDGMSCREEMTVHWIQRALGAWPLVGGSAGDDLRFGQPYVFVDGTFHAQAAALILVETTCPIKLFKTQQFVPGQVPLVVTEADPDTRTVFELNGRRAADEYARLLHVTVDDLNATLLAENPVMVRLDGIDYVRAVRTVNADGSLSFYCAIERGLVLRIGQGVHLLENLQATLEEIAESLGKPQLTLVFDCVFRRFEIEAKGLQYAVAESLAPIHALGFSTYGEQWMGVHVNQTLTGLAIGQGKEGPDADL